MRKASKNSWLYTCLKNHIKSIIRYKNIQTERYGQIGIEIDMSVYRHEYVPLFMNSYLVNYLSSVDYFQSPIMSTQFCSHYKTILFVGTYCQVFQHERNLKAIW